MQLQKRTIIDLAEMICGAAGGAGFERSNFKYRSSTYLTEFFSICGMNYTHDGSARKTWVIETLTEINSGPTANPQLPSDGIIRVIRELFDPSDFQNHDLNRNAALEDLNTSIGRDRLQAYFDSTGACHLRNIDAQSTSNSFQLRRRAWTDTELKKRNALSEYLDSTSEDNFIEKILLPLFQNMGFIRVSATGHKDKSLEYGKDIWMKYQIPTSHYLYFGVQVKRTKIDSAGKSRNENVAEILSQITMMLGHPIWDPELNKQTLVDHVFIISASDITKQAKNWLGQKLNQTDRRHIMFIDRSDLLDQAMLTNLRLPFEKTEIEPVVHKQDACPF